jgi:hypothetical protein
MTRLPGRPLLHALLTREAGPLILAAVLLAAGAGWYAAAVASGQADAGSGPRLILRVLRRTDLVMLCAAAVLAGIRVAVRVAEDHRSRWLEPYCAGGGSTTRYLAYLSLSIAAPWWVIFAVGAGAFSTGVFLRTGSSELLRAWVLLAPAGLLLVGAVTVHVLAAAVVLREPLTTILAAAAAAAAPYVAAAIFIAQGDGSPPPGWLRAWVAAALPLVPAASGAEAARQLAYAGLATAAALAIGRQRTGRRG